MNDCMKINEILEREWDNYVRMSWAANRLCWLKKFRKAPTELLDALMFKCTKLFEHDWYGDEPQEQIIQKHLS